MNLVLGCFMDFMVFGKNLWMDVEDITWFRVNFPSSPKANYFCGRAASTKGHDITCMCFHTCGVRQPRFNAGLQLSLARNSPFSTLHSV